MRKVQLYGLTSLLIAGLLVAGWGSGIAQAAKTPGKMRARTGELLEKEGNRLRVKGTKKQDPVSMMISQETRIVRESLAKTADLVPGAIVRIQGKGKNNQVTAKRLIIVPADQSLRLGKQPQKGAAYPSKEQKTEIIAKVSRTEPLQIVNRYQQILTVKINENSEILKQALAKEESLRVGAKVTVKYLEQTKGNQAKEVIVRIAEKVKQVKK